MLVGECLALPGEAVREFLALRGEAARELGLERLAEGEAVRDDVCEPGCEPAEEPLRNGSGSMVVGEPRGPCELRRGGERRDRDRARSERWEARMGECEGWL